jgi:hypothetical protein
MLSVNQLPGMNETRDPILQSQAQLFPAIHNKVILLATNFINYDTIFMNGLYQNVYFIYRLLENMGAVPFLFVSEKKELKEILKDCRQMTPEDILQKPIPIHSFIEIAMSVDKNMRSIFKSLGAGVFKLYLGNILNIDCETPMFHPQMNFNHHIVGNLDKIWVSPHYVQHAHYAAVMNDLPANCVDIAPYLWEPDFISAAADAADAVTATATASRKGFEWQLPSAAAAAADDAMTATATATDQNKDFIIIEPNISFQKSSLIPLLIVEEYYRKHPEWTGKVILYNGQQLAVSPFFLENILPSLTLGTNNKIVIKPRENISTVLKENPSAIPICHQMNNEYNYMILELLWYNYPVIHNGETWGSSQLGNAGYYYSGVSTIEGARACEEAMRHGDNNMNSYINNSKKVIGAYSIYNRRVQEEWYNLLTK